MMDGGQLGSLLLAAALAIFTFGNALVQLHLTPMGIPPDEAAHLTFVQEVASGQHLIPDYAHSRVLRSGGGNYLGHPPLYYSTLGLVGRAMGWQDAMADYLGYRILSAVLVAIAVALWALAGANLGLSRWKILTCIAACNAIPMFPYLAGSVNNDNLAFLTVALGFYGLSLHACRPNAAYYIYGLALLTGALTKANAAVFLGIFLACWVLPSVREKTSPLRHRHFWIAMALAGCGACAYYVPTFMHYGTFFPKTGQLYAHFAPPANPMALPQVMGQFIRQMIDGLPMVMSHASAIPVGGALRGLFFTMLLAPLAAFFIARIASPSSVRVDRIANAMLVTTAILIGLHFYAVAQTYYQHGRMAALQPRYYNFVLTGLLLCCLLRPAQDRVTRACLGLFVLATAATLSLSLPYLVEGQVTRNLNPSQRVVYSNASAAPADEHLAFRAPAFDGPIGQVELIQLSGNAATISGWAIDKLSRRSASHLVITYDGQVIGIGSTGLARRDIAAQLSMDQAKDAGFTFTALNLPGADPCKIVILVEQYDGSFATLRQSDCDDRPPTSVSK